MRRTRFHLTPLETRDTPVAGYAAVGAAAGGTPLVAVLRPDGSTLAQFPAFETTFRGGVTAAAAELDGDPGTQEVVAGAGPGGGPAVKVFSVDVRTGTVVPRSSFFAFESTFAGGVRVAAGNVAARSDGLDQIVLGAGAGGGPRVRTVDISGTQVDSPLGDFFAFESSFRGGVQVAAGELDNNPFDGTELVVTPDDGGGPRVRVIRSDGAVLADYFAFNPAFRGGANVTVVNGRIVPDAFALDPSQRNTALNTAAFAAVQQMTATTVTTPTTGTGELGGVVTNIGGQVTNIGGQTVTAGDLGAATAVSGLGVTTNQTGIATGVSGVGGIGTSATSAGGISAATQSGGLSSGAVGTTGITGATSAGGLTSSTVASGLTTNSFSTGLSAAPFGTTAATTTVVSVPSAFAFGPFGDPGLALVTPVLVGPVYVPGVRYSVPV